MRTFTQLQIQHQELLERHQDPDLLGDVKAFIEEARMAGKYIGASEERDQLRANLRYWAGYVYERDKTYPNIELPPGPLVLPTVQRFFASRLAVSATFSLLLFFLVLGIVLAQSFYVRLPRPTRTATSMAMRSTPSPISSVTATFHPSETPTLTPFPTVTVRPVTTQIAIAVQISNLHDGDDVQPRLTVQGNYTNLQPGWSIHLLLQPVSKGGRLFPTDSYFVVPSGMTTGKWSIVALFGTDQELEQAEQYNIQVVVALNAAGRSALAAASDAGLDAIPDSVVVFPGVATVHREAYAVIDGIRLLYSAQVGIQRDLFIAEPDGSNIQQLTDTPLLNELEASLSPSGGQIAYVATELGASDEAIISLRVMKSDTTQEVLLAMEAGTTYDRPLWSPDGRYIAYAANSPHNIQRGFGIFVYDTATNEHLSLNTELADNRFPSWEPSGKALVFSAFAAETGTQGLYRIDLASGDVSLVYDTPEEETQPVVSPDGQRVAFVSYANSAPESNRDIYVLDLGTGKVYQITDNTALDWRPQWSPDGASVIFESYREQGVPSIWTTDVGDLLAHQIPLGTNVDHPYVGPMLAFLPITPTPVPPAPW